MDHPAGLLQVICSGNLGACQCNPAQFHPHNIELIGTLATNFSAVSGTVVQLWIQFSLLMLVDAEHAPACTSAEPDIPAIMTAAPLTRTICYRQSPQSPYDVPHAVVCLFVMCQQHDSCSALAMLMQFNHNKNSVEVIETSA